MTSQGRRQRKTIAGRVRMDARQRERQLEQAEVAHAVVLIGIVQDDRDVPAKVVGAVHALDAEVRSDDVRLNVKGLARDRVAEYKVVGLREGTCYFQPTLPQSD